MAQKPSIPKGTRDFSPVEMVKRNYIFDTIKTVFQKYGYLPIETPAMENLSTLLGKYGEEGDRLLFKVLNSGDFLRKIDNSDLEEGNAARTATKISEKGLRYDLTVPFARFVVQHRNEITFPFKRYQIQPVWRADRPQRGRYREFYQCDIDVIGSNSLLNETELIRVIDEVFSKLGVNITIKLNNRKILSGIATEINAPDKLTDITTAIDKLDKIGIDKVYEELQSKGIDENSINTLKPIISLEGSNSNKLKTLRSIFSENEEGTKGVEEMETVLNMLDRLEIKANIEIDQALARGLNYYTGAIIEVKADDVNIGSICGGGRYDNLTGIFGMPDISGVGVSFGADRIYDVLEETDAFPNQVESTSKLMICNFGEKEAMLALKILEELHRLDIKAELYPDTVKIQKQMKYADQKSIPYVLLIGEEEIKSGDYTLKNMETGAQHKLKLSQIVNVLKE
ncbi:MAG: histidine--tRNA ligase [Marinilabiliales bacterium]|nr:MAG: histidine--tRNA ligase [Marinilabiliales bacterium]